MRADAAADKLAVNTERPPEQHDLRSNRQVARTADDDVARPHLATEAFGDPRLHGEIALAIEADKIDAFPMSAEARLIGAQHTLGRDTCYTSDWRSHQIGRHRLVRWLYRQQPGRDVDQRIRRSNQQVSAQPAEPDGHAGADTAQQHATGKHDRA